MEERSAVVALSALAHAGRLAIFRLLVRAGKDGMAAGIIAQRLDVPPNSLSANLAILSRAGLVDAKRSGRSIIYTAAYDRMASLIGYLVEDCCGGAPAICAPLAAVMTHPVSAAEPEACA